MYLFHIYADFLNKSVFFCGVKELNSKQGIQPYFFILKKILADSNNCQYSFKSQKIKIEI